MAEALPCQNPDEGNMHQHQTAHQNPRPSPCSSAPPSQATQEWEARARSWLSSLPKRWKLTTSEMEVWIDSDQSSLPEELKSLPRAQLHERLLSIYKLLEEPSQGENTDQVEGLEAPRARFQRTDMWIPVYSWLESLDTDEVIKAKDITDWLSENPEVKDKLFSRHSRYHLMHYIQKLHMKMLRKRGKLQKGTQICTTRTSMKILDDGARPRAVPISFKFSSNSLEDKETSLFKKNEAFLRYELLTDLQDQLTILLSKRKHVNNLKESCSLSLTRQGAEENIDHKAADAGEKEENTRTMSAGTSQSQDVGIFWVAGLSKPRSPLGLKGARKRKRNAGVAIPAWSYCEALAGSLSDQSSCSHFEESSIQSIGNEDEQSSSLQRSSSRKSVAQPKGNIIKCLQGRERGISWPLACSHGGYAGRNQEKWIPFLEGWKSLGRQFEGHSVRFKRRSYSSWIPTWCAYTSSVAVAQPFGRVDQAVQKVLDVRFHPEGLAQLVCSSNEAPNELLLYNLLSGRAIELTGHNCQIQAVEFAVKGASVVSCGANLLKVWDSTTGSCLFTLGPVGDGRASNGHAKKINAMSVNSWQSCLVVTSGGQGDGKLLLWNALTGELSADLNISLRVGDQVLPCIEAMEFCSQNLLVCGSDSAYGDPAVVQLWDIETQSCQSFPANDSYITSLKINPDCNTIITGSGDGAVCLFDIRTCSGISHLSVGSSYEVTSVSFSSCGTYFHASSTSNNTLVWDTRLIPMSRGQIPVEGSLSINNFSSMRPLHCLSHGKQMPTAEHAGQLPGHVDEGDQGVNDARWLQREPVLVTVSGDGSIAMWDVTLGQPCVRHLNSHTRCANTVTVAPNDEYLCSGGDDQKVVLYHNTKGRAHAKWRLSHPLMEVEL